MVISDIRRRILEENKVESDVDYVKRQYDNMRIPYPCSILGATERDRLRLRTMKTSSDEPTPYIRILLLSDSSITKKPSSWWGPGDGNSIRDDENCYSLFHIPPSINKVTLSFTNDNYNIGVGVYTNQFQPKKDASISPTNRWYTVNDQIVFNASNINYDTWICYSIKCVKNGGTPKIYNNYRIIYNNEASFKESLGLRIIVE